jgi:hypothetical protein
MNELSPSGPTSDSARTSPNMQADDTTRPLGNRGLTSLPALRNVRGRAFEGEKLPSGGSFSPRLCGRAREPGTPRAARPICYADARTGSGRGEEKQ